MSDAAWPVVDSPRSVGTYHGPDFERRCKVELSLPNGLVNFRALSLDFFE